MSIEPVQTIIIEAAIAEGRRHADMVDPILKMINFLEKVTLPDSDKTNRVMAGLSKDIEAGLIELATNKDVPCPMVASLQYQPEDGRAIIWLPENFMEILTGGSSDQAQQLAALIYSASYTREMIHGGYTVNTHARALERSNSFLQIAEKHPDLITKAIATAEP